MTIIRQADYEAIRKAIDVSLDSSVLPDSVIELPIYRDAAEAEVIAADADALTRSGSEAVAICNAAIYLCAARLAMAVPQLQSERMGADYQYTRQIDYSKRATELRTLADRELATILLPTTGQVKPTFFTVASGRRGK